jgi:hypothetical protein
MAKFNKEFYIANNPTVKDSGKTAFEHFVTEGWSLGLAANKEEDVLTGDDVITEVVSLSGDEIALLLLKMSAENMRLLDEGSEALDIPQLMITNFDAFKATMKPKEVSKLVEDTPLSLAGMDKDDFRFLEKDGTFDLGQALNSFDDSTVVQLFKGFTPEAFEFIEAKGTYELGAKLTSMSAENLATVLGAQTVDGIAFMQEVDSFDLGAEITTMSDQHLVKVLKNVEFGSIRNIEGFNIGARLAKMTDDFLSDSMSEWSEGHLDSLLTLDDFDMGAEMAAMDSTNRAHVLGDWGVDSLKAIDAASDAFKISDVVFGSGNMDDFAKIKPSDMLGLLATMDFEDIKSAVKRMTGDNLAFIDSADGFEWGAVMGAVDDSLFAELTGSWDQSSLNYVKGLSAESKHVFDMESRLDNLDKENLKKVLENEGAWTFFDEMESFDLEDKLLNGLSEESFFEIAGGLAEGSDAKTYLSNNTTLTIKINETLTDSDKIKETLTDSDKIKEETLDHPVIVLPNQNDDSPPPIKPFTISANGVKAGDVNLPSTYSLATDEDLIKLTLVVDMAGIGDETFSSIGGAELDLFLDWTQFESFSNVGSSQDLFYTEYLANELYVLENKTTDGMEQLKLTIISVRTQQPQLTIVDRVDNDLPSSQALLAIYLKPIDDFSGSQIEITGLVISANSSEIVITQPISTFDLFS